MAPSHVHSAVSSFSTTRRPRRRERCDPSGFGRPHRRRIRIFDRLGDRLCGSRGQAGPVRRSQPASGDVPASDVVVTVWLSHASSQPARDLNPALRNASGMPERSFASGQDVSDVTTRRRTAVRTHLAARTSVCGSDAFTVSISRRARASARTVVDGSCRGFRIRSSLRPPASLRVSDVANRPRSLFRDRPDLATAGRHSCEGSGLLGRLSPFYGGIQLSLDLFGCVGRIPGGDPGPLDRCLQLTIWFSK